MKRIFIFGITGMLGRYVYNYFLQQDKYDIIGLSRKEIDLSNIVYFSKLDKQFTPDDVIINCAGIITQRKGVCNLDYILVNSVFPQYISKLCKETGAKFINVSSDCVFDGALGNYSEDATPNNTDIYGRTKALGETKTDTIIRTSLIGEEEHNKYSLLEWVRANDNKRVNGYVDHFWNGITCLQFAKICEYIIDNSLYWKGVRNITSPTKVSKYELVKMIAEIYALGIDITKYYTGTFCDRSLVSKYDLRLNIPNLRYQLEEQRSFIWREI